MPSASRNLVLVALGVALGLALGVARGVLAQKPAAPASDLPWADARTLAEVMARVKQDYVERVDDHRLLQAAIRGMVSSLDPYSEYLDRDEYDQLKVSSTGEYSGVGLELSLDDDQVIIVAPFEGSPAAAAGIRAGDVLSTIDGTAVNGTNLAETIGRLRGREGTVVHLGILRGTSDQPLQFALKRERVELHSVRSYLLAPGFGYLRIAQFSETTDGEVQAALASLRTGNGAALKGLVLDLRDNPGGVLEAGVAVADEFLDAGVIVSGKGREPNANFEMDATPGDRMNGAPIVVLVDGGSASAAEIVAGALRDDHRATLIGRRTFGKGSVQTVMPLPGDSALKLTTSLYFTPSGASINHKGIAPDIELKREPNSTGTVPTDESGVRADLAVQRALKEVQLQSVSGRPSLSAALVAQ